MDRLHKSRTQRILFGVTGGVAEYLTVDVVLVRVGFVALALVNGIGILMYIALAIFMPEAPGGEAGPGSAAVRPQSEVAADRSQRNRYLIGAILIIVGVIFLLERLRFLWWLDWGVLWPVVLIAIGLALIAGRLRR